MPNSLQGFSQDQKRTSLICVVIKPLDKAAPWLSGIVSTVHTWTHLLRDFSPEKNGADKSAFKIVDMGAVC